MATGVAQNLGLTRLAMLGLGGGGTTYANANSRIGVGDDGTAPTAADGTILGTAVWKAADATFPTSPVVGNKYVMQATFAAGAVTLPIKEVVWDNGAGPGEALVRTVLDAAEWVTPGITDIPRVKVEIQLA